MNRNRWRHPLTAGGLILLVLLAIGIGIGLQGRGIAHAQVPISAENPTVRVQGYAEKSAVPTIAYLNIGVQTHAEDVKTAQEENNTAMDKVLSAIKEKGIVEKNIQTANYYVNPRYDMFDSNITGYEVINDVRVKVEDITKAGETIDAAIAAGANHSNSISFDITAEKRDELYKEALRDAVKQAEGNAKVLAESINAQLGTIVQVIEGGTAQPYARGAEEYAAMGDSMQVIPGETAVGATVTIIYNTK